MIAIGTPTGANSNMPIGSILYCRKRPLTTRLVLVLMSVTELVRIEEKASGMRSFEGLIFARFAMPMTIGTKNAVEAVLLTNAPIPADVSITTRSKWVG